MRELIHRATEHNVTGRTIEGLAYRFDHASRVVDPGKPPYMEAFSRGSANKTLKERGTYPLAYFHGLSADTPGSRSRFAGETFGPVVFRAGPDGLEFEATLSNTRGADEMLELLSDGAVGDVSIAAWPIKSSRRDNIVWRDEISIAELSLAPVGHGQHAGAKVLAMRADNRTRLEALRRRRALLIRG